MNQIRNPAIISSPDCLFRDIVAALRNTLPDASDCQLRT
jgi:hypothetical protein